MTVINSLLLNGGFILLAPDWHFIIWSLAVADVGQLPGAASCLSIFIDDNNVIIRR